MTDALMQSNSGYVRGSVFTACLVAQAAREHGLDMPLPRAEPRIGVQVVPLPPSAPFHSFTFARVSPLRPSKKPLEEFVRKMQGVERHLGLDAANVFQLRGSKSIVSWISILPIDFTADVVGQISVKPDNGFLDWHNGMFEGLQGGPLPTLLSQRPRFDPLLIKLATAMPDFGNVPFVRKAIYSRICADFRRHIADPQRYPSPLGTDTIEEESLLLVLRGLHVQAVAIQLIARVLGWWKGDTVVAFLPWKFKIWNFDKMIESGIKINELPSHLRVHHFPEYVQFFKFI